MDFAGLRLGALAIPMFHGMGMAAMCFMVGFTACFDDQKFNMELPQVFGGMILSSYKPASPPAIPNPDSVYEGAVRTKRQVVRCNCFWHTYFYFQWPHFLRTHLYRGETHIFNYFSGAHNYSQLWSRNPQRVEYLAKNVKGVVSISPAAFFHSIQYPNQFYGGGPLNKAVGDGLTSKGVTIYQMFAR